MTVKIIGEYTLIQVDEFASGNLLPEPYVMVTQCGVHVATVTDSEEVPNELHYRYVQYVSVDAQRKINTAVRKFLKLDS